jgi:hypothetical protein
MKRSLLKRFLITLGVLLMLSPCAACWWIAFGESAVFSASLPVFPGANQISEAYGYYGAGTGVEFRYFWTAASIDEVKAYYETFTVPFVQAQESSSAGHDQFYSVFNPFGEPVPIITEEYRDEIFNAAESRYCRYRMFFNCVMVRITQFDLTEAIVLPPPPVIRMVRTPWPFSSQLRGGTLIIYTYNLPDIS